MSRPQQVPGLSDEWAAHQLTLPLQSTARRMGGHCVRCGHTHRVLDRECRRCTCTARPEPVAR